MNVDRGVLVAVTAENCMTIEMRGMDSDDIFNLILGKFETAW